jgi:hypothetical protein
MNAKVKAIVQRIRAERYIRIEPMIRGGRIPTDTEAVLRHCKSCSNAAIHLQEIPSNTEFSSLNAFTKYLRTISGNSVCGKCGEARSTFMTGLYCQFRRKDRLDLQFIAGSNDVSKVEIVDHKGFYWELPLDLVAESIDSAIARSPKPEPCDRIGQKSSGPSDSAVKKEQQKLLENVQKFLLEFEETRLEDPLIFGPSSLPATILNEAIDSYAEVPDNEAPLVVIGLNRHSPGRDGILLSSAKLYGSELPSHQPIAFQDIEEVEIRKGLLGSGIYVNGVKALTIKGFLEPNAKLISFLLKQLSKATEFEAPKKKPEKKAPPKRNSGDRSTGARERSPRSSRAGLGKGRPRAPIRHGNDENLALKIKKGSGGAYGTISRGRLEELIEDMGARKVPGDLLHVINIPPEMVTVAKRSYARSIQDETPLAMVKANLGEDSSQCLITEYSVFSNELFANAPRGLKFDEIFAVDLLDDEEEQMLDLNGQPFLTQGRLPDWVLPQIQNILQVASGSESQEDQPAAAPAEEPVVPRKRPTEHLIPPPKVGFAGPSAEASGKRLSRPVAGGQRPSRSASGGQRPSRSAGGGQRRGSSEVRPLRPPRPPAENRKGGDRPSGRSGVVTPPPRHRASSKVQSLEGSGLNRLGGRRVGSRPRLQRGFDLTAIDFNVELVEEANRLFLSKKFEEALGLVEEAQNVNPMNAALTYAQAAILAALGERTAALDCLLKAIRYGFARRDQIIGDNCWQPFRSDPDFNRLMRRIDNRARSKEFEALDQVRSSFVYLLSNMTEDLPAEVRVIHCRSCNDYHLDPAQIDYDYRWNTVEGFQLEAIAPLSSQQMTCEKCGALEADIVGTTHAFPIGEGAIHLVYWLVDGCVRSRFLFESNSEGFISEIRTFFDVEKPDYDALEVVNQSLLLRLQSPYVEVIEGAVRDLAIPGNSAVLDVLYDLLEQAALDVDNHLRCIDPWLVREILETLIVIGEEEALDVVFQMVSHLLTHETIDEALGFAVVDTIVAFGGLAVLGDLYGYVNENVPNVSPDVIGVLALAILDNAESQGDFQLADEAGGLCADLGIN